VKMAQSKYKESGDSLSCMTPASEGKEVLVPLTGSMYVPGLLSEPSKVIVDIGTGYYVEKESTAAQEYFDRKVKFVTENMERVQAIGNEKAKIRELVMDVMQEKLKGQFTEESQKAK
jgi:prefoldin alpha subunit